MASALDEFRAQREAADAIHARLEETAALLRSVLAETQTLAHSEALRTLLRDEQTWLVRAEQVITTMRHQREWEVHRFWPAVWRRWVVAVMFAVVTTGAASAGYVWAARPDAAELADLRARNGSARRDRRARSHDDAGRARPARRANEETYGAKMIDRDR